MAAVFLDNQIFYAPPIALGATRIDHHALPRYADVSAAISETPPIPPASQNAKDPRHGSPGDSPDDALLITDSESNCGDPGDDDDRSDITFPSLDELLTAPFSRVAATADKHDSATSSISDDRDVNEPSITEAEPNDESASTQHQQSRTLQCSPTPLPASLRTSHEEKDQPIPASSCRPPHEPARSRSIGDTESPQATEDDLLHHPWSPHNTLSESVEIDCSSVPSQPSTKPSDNAESLHSAQDEGQGGTLYRDSANAKSAMQSSANQALVSPQRVLGPHQHRDTDDEEVYRPTEGSDAEHSQDDVRPRLRKRRRVNVSNPLTSGTAAQQTHQEETVKDAKFEEWPLENAVFKRVTLDGIATFQLQFSWDPCLDQDRHRVRSSIAVARSQGSPKPTLRRARYTPQDDAKICQLKEQGLSWLAIAKQLPGRSAPAIEARYYAKLKPSPSLQRQRRHNTPQTPVVDDSNGVEWDVEEISNHRKSDSGGLEFPVKWKGGDETWEPFEYVAETEALDKYEHLHGQLA
ncbi:hypothetical protein QBC37DRAFT_300861 [Rhypophila decipiens]|uniref:Myb-like domain-containing protein n=1 Tax=Rhypophila decipiens TaxID=261697 RepID=A0AAN6XT46_9PEZI|nr:hypothetical protein QBC37DRAFT_300861 [Rhypophila decipiens]